MNVQIERVRGWFCPKCGDFVLSKGLNGETDKCTDCGANVTLKVEDSLNMIAIKAAYKTLMEDYADAILDTCQGAEDEIEFFAIRGMLKAAIERGE
jgi:hypothetical protein